jgi:hypothetical protein
LHSLGGLIGAAAATTKTKSPEQGSVAASYWLILIFLTLITVGVASASSATVGLMIGLIFLPLLQLAASVVTLVWMQFRSKDLPYKQEGKQILAKITAWSFVAAALGLGAMVLGFKMFH